MKNTAVILAFLLVASPAFAQAKTTGENLYLLGETAVDLHGSGAGLNLYSLDSSHNLKLVRVIVPALGPAHPGDFGNGLYAVRDDTGDKIYVTYPNIVPSILSVIHKARPAMKDEVDFNPHHFTVLTTDFGIAAGDGRQSYLLCTFLRPIPNYKGPYPGGISSSLVSVAGDATAKGARVRQADWAMFSSFRYQGAPAGGAGSAIVGYIKDDRLQMRAEAGPGPYTLKVDLDSVPTFPLPGRQEDTIFILVANARYIAFAPLIHMADDGSIYTATPYLCVHDRKQNTWKRLTSASTVVDTRRIFGSWLATIVEVWHPGELVEIPGAGYEPEPQGAARSTVPEWGPNQTSIPGTLVLDNLEDGRRIVLDTGQEDSEILDVRSDGLVLYRVNDSIFAAQIERENLSKPTLVVKDDGVQGVHWIFWSLSEPCSGKLN